MDVKVSIIVPVYNVPEKYLRKCLQSLINQTLKEIEIIVVDDGSKDNSGSICDEYAAVDSRIKVIHKKNGGLAAARNTGFLAATGKWITFVDGDDWLSPETCEYAYKAGENHDATLVFWGAYKEYENISIPYLYEYKDMKLYTKEECKVLQARVLDFDGNIGCAYAKLIKREYLVQNCILHDENLRQGGEGIEFNIRLFDGIDRVFFIHNLFYHYTFNPNSISASHDEKNHHYVLKCFKKIKKFIDASPNKSLMIESFYNRLIYVMVTTAVSGYFNPDNKEPYRDKIKKYKEFISDQLFKEALEKADMSKIIFSRRVTLFCIKKNLYFAVAFIAWIRRKQLYSR